MKSKVINVIATLVLMGVAITLSLRFADIGIQRFIESLRDVLKSIVFCYEKITGKENSVAPTVIEYSSKVNNGQLFNAVKTFVALFIDKNNILVWLKGYGIVLFIIIDGILGIYVIIKIFGRLITRIYRKQNNNYNKDTLPLKTVKCIEKAVVVPILNLIKGHIGFIKNSKVIRIAWLILFLIIFNILTVITETFAYEIYFLTTIDTASVLIQVNKLLIDIAVTVIITPIAVWGIVWIFLFERTRRGIADDRLRHYEARDCGFIKELQIVEMSVGSMGKKKTTHITDMALSQAVMFRQEALKRLQKTDMRFPYFPWISYERELRKCMDYGVIYNLASIKRWVRLKRARFNKHKDSNKQLYGYDIVRYGRTYYDEVKETDIFDAMETYGQLYYIFVIESSLIVSNYSIREDDVLIDTGNFPLWMQDFFPSERRMGRFSHILDFDLLRLGKKVIKESVGTFEFGVIAITEIGKERGNNLELKEVKKGTESTNQKNDLFNSWLKMCRHSATVDNYPFIKVFCDEQRASSWGADARELADIVTIVKSGEQRLTLPFYTIEEMVSEWAFSRFIDFYYRLRFYRGDNTLTVYLLKKITAQLFRRNERIYNRYGYSVLSLEKEKGTMDGRKEKKKYFLCNKKIYADRFTTDCFSDYFNEMGYKSKKGLKDYIEYASSKASVNELLKQNSYFINSLYNEEDG